MNSLLKYYVCVYLAAKSCPTLYDSMDCGPPHSSAYGIFQARILEGVAISSFRGSSHPGIKPEFPASPALAGGFLTMSHLESPSKILIYILKKPIKHN